MDNHTHNIQWYFNKRIFGWKFHAFKGAIGWELQVGTHYWILKFKCCQYKTASGKRFTHHVDPYGRR